MHQHTLLTLGKAAVHPAIDHQAVLIVLPCEGKEELEGGVLGMGSKGTIGVVGPGLDT